MNKVVIIAPFGAFSEAYSLANVVCDQVRGLVAKGFDVEVWVMKNTIVEGAAVRGIESHIKKIFTPLLFEEDTPKLERASVYGDEILDGIKCFDPNIIITHDAVFQAYYIDFAYAIHLVNDHTRDISWFHYAHSIVNTSEEVKESNYWRRRVPDGHFVIYPNEVMRDKAAQYYEIDVDRVFSVPNPRDPRSMWNISQGVCELIGKYGLFGVDILTVLPLCTTRIHHKGLTHTIQLLNHLSEMGLSCCLVCCNSHGAKPKEQEKIQTYKEFAKDFDLVFTSEERTEWVSGVPNSVVSELMRISDIFTLFSLGEVCSLTLAEAQAAGCLCLMNSTLDATTQYAAPHSITVALDAFNKVCSYNTVVKTQTVDHETGAITLTEEKLDDKRAYDEMMKQLALATLDRLALSSSYRARKFAFNHYTWDVHAAGLVKAFTQSRESATC